MNISANYTQRVSFGQKPETQEKLHFRNKGFIRGSIAKQMTALPFTIASLGLINLAGRKTQLDPCDAYKIEKAASKAVKGTGLEGLGCRIRYINNFDIPEDGKVISEQLSNFLDNVVLDNELVENPPKGVVKAIDKAFGFKKNPIDRKILGDISEEIKNRKPTILTRFKDSIVNAIASKKEFPEEFVDSFTELEKRLPLINLKLGTKAKYLANANKLIVSEETFTPSVFEGIGHALNNNFSKIGKELINAKRIALIAVPVISILALTTKRRVNDKPKDRKINGGLDFIKRNAGTLTILAFTPKIIEKAMAIFKGNKLAKETLKDAPALLKKVRVNNVLSIASCVIAAVGSAIALKAGISAKDNIQHEYETNKVAKFEAKQAKLAAKQV